MKKILIRAESDVENRTVIASSLEALGYVGQKRIGDKVIVLNPETRKYSVFNKVSSEKTAGYIDLTLEELGEARMIHALAFYHGYIRDSGMSSFIVSADASKDARALVAEKNMENTEGFPSKGKIEIRFDSNLVGLFSNEKLKCRSDFEIGCIMGESTKLTPNISGNRNYDLDQLGLLAFTSKMTESEASELIFGCEYSKFASELYSETIRSYGGSNLLVHIPESVTKAVGNFNEVGAWPLFAYVRKGMKVDVYDLNEFIQASELSLSMFLNMINGKKFDFSKPREATKFRSLKANPMDLTIKEGMIIKDPFNFIFGMPHILNLNNLDVTY